MSTESPYHCPFVAGLKKNAFKSDFCIHFFMFHHYVYIAAGRGRQSIGDNRKAFSLCPYVASFKMISLKSDWGQSRQSIGDNRKAFSLCPYVASFKMICLKSDFIHIFNDFIHVYSPSARAENPLGTNF